MLGVNDVRCGMRGGCTIDLPSRNSPDFFRRAIVKNIGQIDHVIFNKRPIYFISNGINGTLLDNEFAVPQSSQIYPEMALNIGEAGFFARIVQSIFGWRGEIIFQLAGKPIESGSFMTSQNT